MHGIIDAAFHHANSQLSAPHACRLILAVNCSRIYCNNPGSGSTSLTKLALNKECQGATSYVLRSAMLFVERGCMVGAFVRRAPPAGQQNLYVEVKALLGEIL